jgi:hypothetical protein
MPHDHKKTEEKSTTKTLGTTFASGKVARTTHDHNKEKDERHVRFKQDISPLSSIFDKSKATLINVFVTIVIQQQTNAATTT